MNARISDDDLLDRDDGDLDGGDQCPTEAENKVLDKWHPSFSPAKITTGVHCVTPEIERKYVDEALQILSKKREKKEELRKPVNLASWSQTPELYRRMIARVAGLSIDVVKKIDRDLTESEKVMLRAASSDLREWSSRLAGAL